MKLKNISIIIILLFSLNTFSQQYKCSEIIQYAKNESYSNDKVNSYQLTDSSWLKSVEAYHFTDNSTIVIAIIKNDNYSTRKYVFCGISFDNWVAFSSGAYDYDKTYGERFHKYIFNNKCDCN